ncbi:MAG: iron chelate uptake ABC transporter family permease subunit [Saprospiraceae bacterium]|jgi:ABC-type Mn2+/Zn2+ transport system permease subunit/Mn-dependent DtxR family transcriptional regulator|tara:strand:+ start:9758 stop:11242 length:1485 start_codon:yes stop_codon:yes gene_type:complete
MQELFNTLSEPFAIRAIMACSMVGVMCGIIGCFIVLRNMSLIGDALSHAILPGIFVSFIFLGYSTIGFFVGSVLAGILSAFMITWIQHNVKTKNDASIGIVFTVMFSLGVIGISWLNSEKGAHLDLGDFLFGNALGVSNEDLVLTAVVMLYTMASVALFYRYLFITTFQPTIAATMGISVKMVHYFLMLLLSFAVVAALRTVGVILVVAMLITPSSTALLLSNKLKVVIVISACIGLVSAILGMILSIFWNTPPGPMMVVVSTFFYALAVLFAFEKGLLPRAIRRYNQSKKIEREDIIKYAFKFFEKKKLTISEIQQYLGLKENRIKSHLDYLKKDGLLSIGSGIGLTYKGKQKAEGLVRAHRLWESYQVDSMGLLEGQIHEEAEILEHHLSEEILDQLDKKLGFPSKDPHGSPIPPKIIAPKRPLLNIKLGTKAFIAKEQISDQVESELWELGLLPDSAITLVKVEKDVVKVKYQGRPLVIRAQLAGLINTKR